MKQFDIDQLERKNIYKVPDNLFENIQSQVLSEIKTEKKAPIFRLNCAYAAAASVAVIFGVTFIFNSDGDSGEELLNPKSYAVQKEQPKTESERAYDTLQADLTSVENNNQIIAGQGIKSGSDAAGKDSGQQAAPKSGKAASSKQEARVNEYLDSFSSSEIAELASNSTQDVYLDVFN